LATFRLPFRYSKQDLWSLFLITAFPIHVWTIILVLRDLSWVTERTNVWDAIGVGSYGLVFAFIESVVVFLILVLLGLLIPGKWREEKRLALLAVLFLVIASWAIAGQLYFLVGITLPGWIYRLLAQSSHPLQVLYGGVLSLVLVTVLIPTALVIQSSKAMRVVRGLIERLSLLTLIYLFLDFVGLVIVILRNI
jgi:hypothetical protein